MPRNCATLSGSPGRVAETMWAKVTVSGMLNAPVASPMRTATMHRMTRVKLAPGPASAIQPARLG